MVIKLDSDYLNRLINYKLMKHILFAILIIGIFTNSFGQNRTNIWMLSNYSVNEQGLKAGIDFSIGSADTFSFSRAMGFFKTNASICDTNGDLIFYTNGIWIANKNHDTLLNSNNFNPGFWTDFYSPGGTGISQGAIVIPRPDYPEEYYVFAVSGEFALFYDKIYAPLHLSLSKVDMALDGGLGGILEGWKDQHLVEDTLVWGRLTACKHANGRDWWIVSHKFHTDTYYKFLVTPDSILGPYKQNIGSIITSDILGTGVFSSDGTKFAYVSPNDTLDLFDFNRCSGEFSNPVKIITPDSFFISAAFSPSSRFLYVGSIVQVLQYDMNAIDIENSKIQIAAWDSTLYSGWIPTYFSDSQVAPDGRIYFGTFHSINSLSYIEHPDSIGAACNFLQNAFVLPYFNFSLPNFPNYDLDALPGGDTCTAVYTIHSSLSKNNFSYRIAPNPVSDWLNIIYQSNEDALLQLFDLYGKRVGAISLFHYFKNRLLNVSELPQGVYLAAVSCKGERVWSEKVVVQR